MPKDGDNFGPEYLYSEDLLRKGVYLTVKVQIEEVIPAGTLRTASKKLIDRPTLRFVGKNKMLVLNKTNESVLKFIVGDGDISNAAGTTITLEPRDIKFGKEDWVALRIMPPPGLRIRKSVSDRLGKPASRPEQPRVKEQAKPKERTEYEQAWSEIHDTPLSELQASSASIMLYINKHNSGGAITDEQFAQLGGALNTRLAEVSEADESTEEPTTPAQETEDATNSGPTDN